MLYFKLTNSQGQTIRVNSDNISYYGLYNSGYASDVKETNVGLKTGMILFVQETPEQIDDFIIQTGGFFKKTHPREPVPEKSIPYVNQKWTEEEPKETEDVSVS